MTYLNHSDILFSPRCDKWKFETYLLVKKKHVDDFKEEQLWAILIKFRTLVNFFLK